MMKTLPSLAFLLAAGCTVMVNGKPKKIGGGSDPAPTTQAASAPSSTTAATNAKSGAAPAKAKAVAAAKLIAVPASLTATPLVTRVEGVVFDTTYYKLFGSHNSPDCGNEITSAPIASFELKQAAPSLNLSLVGGPNDGFVLRKGDALWFACTHSTNQVPGIESLKEGWQPGRYDIYPVTRYSRHRPTHDFDVELSDPTKPMPWSESIKKVTIAQKLTAPMFVEVTTRPDRRKLRAAIAGWGCDKAAFAAEPDLVLAIERPIPGLVIRPLPSTTPVTLRKELRDAKKQADKGCPTYEQRYSTSDYTPSYYAQSEIHFGNDDEGTYGISIGTADPAQKATVTLMIFDKDTKLEPLAAHAYGSAESIERRWLGLYFPQLDLRKPDGDSDYASAELAAKLFAAAPKQTFVYAKLDMDKDIAHGSAEAFPKKNEPLLVMSVGGERAEVLAADGLRFTVKTSHLLLSPDGAPAVPTAPRSLGKLDIGAAIRLLPPSAKSLVTAREKRVDAWQKCTEKAWAPYGRQLPTYTRPAGVDIVVYESPRTKAIRRAGQAAMDKKCGSDDAQAKKTEAERVKMVAEVEKARVKLLAQATASLKP